MKENVERAADFMDARYPGWARKVDLDKLTMLRPEFCVAGQNGLDWEQVGREFAEWSGLHPADSGGTFASYGVFWEEEIKKRTLVEA